MSSLSKDNKQTMHHMSKNTPSKRIIAIVLLFSQVLTSCDHSNSSTNKDYSYPFLKKGDTSTNERRPPGDSHPREYSSERNIDNAATEFSNYQQRMQREREARLSTRFNLDDKVKEEHRRIDEDQKRRRQAERENREESYRAFLEKYPGVREIRPNQEEYKEKRKKQEEELYKKYGKDWKIKEIEEGFKKIKENTNLDQDQGIEQEIRRKRGEDWLREGEEKIKTEKQAKEREEARKEAEYYRAREESKRRSDESWNKMWEQREKEKELQKIAEAKRMHEENLYWKKIRLEKEREEKEKLHLEEEQKRIEKEERFREEQLWKQRDKELLDEANERSRQFAEQQERLIEETRVSIEKSDREMLLKSERIHANAENTFKAIEKLSAYLKEEERRKKELDEELKNVFKEIRNPEPIISIEKSIDIPKYIFKTEKIDFSKRADTTSTRGRTILIEEPDYDSSEEELEPKYKSFEYLRELAANKPAESKPTDPGIPTYDHPTDAESEEEDTDFSNEYAYEPPPFQQHIIFDKISLERLTRSVISDKDYEEMERSKEKYLLFREKHGKLTPKEKEDLEIIRISKEKEEAHKKEEKAKNKIEEVRQKDEKLNNKAKKARKELSYVVEDHLLACKEDATFNNQQEELLAITDKFKHYPDNKELQAIHAEQLAKFHNHPLYKQSIELGLQAAALRREADKKAASASLYTLGAAEMGQYAKQEDETAKQYEQESKELRKILLELREITESPNTPPDIERLAAGLKGMGENILDTGKAVVNLAKFVINLQPYPVKQYLKFIEKALPEDAIFKKELQAFNKGLDEDIINVAESLKNFVSKAQHAWENLEEYLARLQALEELSERQDLYRRAFDAENYHLEQDKQGGYWTAELLQLVCGAKVVEALAKCTIKGAQWVAKGGKAARGVEEIAGGVKAAGKLEKGVHEFGGGARLVEEIETVSLGLGKSLEKGEALYNFSEEVAKHMAEPARKVSIQIMNEVIKTGKVFPDPQGSRACMYYSKIWRNSKQYNLEILYDKATNSIWHFQYSRDAMGPLRAILK